MKVVANSSVLISRSCINRLLLLEEKFKRVFIPEAVWQEVVESGEVEPGAEAVQNAAWVEVMEVGNKNLVKALQEFVDSGESEAIALALEIKADLILMDEKEARVLARKYGLNVMGTVGNLVWAKKAGRIKTLKDILDDLITLGNFRISNAIYRHALKEAGEK